MNITTRAPVSAHSHDCLKKKNVNELTEILLVPERAEPPPTDSFYQHAPCDRRARAIEPPLKHKGIASRSNMKGAYVRQSRGEQVCRLVSPTFECMSLETEHPLSPRACTRCGGFLSRLHAGRWMTTITPSPARLHASREHLSRIYC